MVAKPLPNAMSLGTFSHAQDIGRGERQQADSGIAND